MGTISPLPVRRVAGVARQGARPRHLLWGLPWLALLGYLTHTAWFLCDDAFISFRYARNLLEGHGLVFNPGEYVEGYSNFLWVLELAALWGAFGLRPEHTAPWLSVACTIGTLAAMLWWVGRLPGLSHRRLVAWMAVGLVCSSATFAVWTSAGGLETRQFTLFVVLAVVGLTLYPENRRALLGVSLSLAAASLTRPEGPLFAACCFGWYAVQRRVGTGRWGLGWRDATALVAPFVLLVAGHYLWRYGYYGEWLPNTYYAKYVRPWYEMGIRYLAAATVETGMYLLVPLAILAGVRDWRARRSLVFVLPLFCIGLHMAYVARIGGDRFGYRLLDVYWPLLAVPAAAGIVQLGRGLAATVRQWPPCPTRRSATRARIAALLLFLPVVFYCGAIQATRHFSDSKSGKTTLGWLQTAPGMPTLVSLSEDLKKTLNRSGIRSIAILKGAERTPLREWRPYTNMARGIIPADALAFTAPAGIPPYFVPDLRFIDTWGLTDATIARNPVTRPNSRRKMNHDRQPPPGYLAARGVNFAVHPSATSREEALARALYAVPVGPDLWMPFDAPSLAWVAARFEEFVMNAAARRHCEAHRRCEAQPTNARWPPRDRFDVSLDGNWIIYVKARCTGDWRHFFLHVTPKDVVDLPAHRRQHGFDNLDFELSPPMSVGRTRCCVAVRELPAYPIASIRTGQFEKEGRNEYRHVWMKEFHIAEDN